MAYHAGMSERVDGGWRTVKDAARRVSTTAPQAGAPSEFAETSRLCSLCQQPTVDACLSGWLLGGDRSARRCPNATNAAHAAQLSRCNVPDLYRSSTLDGFAYHGLRGEEQLAEARETCISYVRGFIPTGETRTVRGLLLVGPPGCGKTHLACATLQGVVRLSSTDGVFIDFSTLCNDLQATFGAGTEAASESAVLRPLLDSPLLVLDELGGRRPTPYVRDVLYFLINTRYVRRLPTIYTTNHPLATAPPTRRPATADRVVSIRRDEERQEEFEHLEDRIGSKVASRLSESTAIVVLDKAGDYRSRLTK